MPNIGLYSVQPAGILDVGELLVVWPARAGGNRHPRPIEIAT